jgi:hypothetical protein
MLLLLALAACQPDIYYESDDPVFRTGDNPRWAAKGYDDAGWQAERGPTGRQVFWVRDQLTFPRRDPAVPLGLLVRAFGGFEVYWDGTLIGRNGRPALGGQPEVPGTETSYYLVPDSLARPGRHVVALRATQVHLGEVQRFVQAKVLSYPRMLREPLLIMAFMNLIAGALLIAALYYLFLFASGSRREPGTLVFSLICFLSVALLLLEYVKFYVAIPYPYFIVRLEIIGWLTFAVALLVPLYFAIQFGLPHRGRLVGAQLAVLLALYVVGYHEYDLSALRFSQAMWLASVAVVLLALRRRAPGSRLVLLGLLLSAGSNYFLYFDYSLYITFAIIVLCMLYLHTIRVRAMETEHRSAQLLSARLKLELLKKNIQPHFIKNTLTSMLDWVEESPQQGAVFIQALATEFDLLNAMAEATLIPVSQELELCRQHLQVMQFRKEVRYELEPRGIEPDELIPPAIFHTVLENGITHSLPPADGCIRFQLSFRRQGRRRQYELLTRARNRPATPGRPAGTGFRYIAARLTESYGQNWAFQSAAVPEGWLTSITIEQAP